MVAHPDDEVIGPGGTLARHAAAGDEVAVLVLADGKTSQPAGSIRERAYSHQETAAAAAALGVARWRRLDMADNKLDSYSMLELARRVSETVDEFGAETVYTHHAGDLNIDHELASRACAISCRPHVSQVQWLLTFATLSATDAGYAGRPPFLPSVFVDISDTLEAKVAAMRGYASKLRGPPHPRSIEIIRAQAQLTGAFANVAAAEGFAVVRGTFGPGWGMKQPG